MIKKYLQKAPKFLFWFVLLLTVTFAVGLFSGSCIKVWWLTIPQAIVLLSFFLFPSLFLINLLLIILSFFLKLEVKSIFLWATLFLTVTASMLGPVSSAPCQLLDQRRILEVEQVKFAEDSYFEKYNEYGTYDELIEKNIIATMPRIYKNTNEYYPLTLSEDKQKFEVKIKLDRGGWYVCNEEKCNEEK